jgi:hypothetical protein
MIARSLVVLVAAGLAITPAGAQRLPVDDSLAAFVGIDSRLLWRAVTLADGVGLQSGVSVPLRSFARGLQLELYGWTALESRDRFRFGDQYSASVHYQIPLQRPPASTSLILLFTEYLTPHSLISRDHSEEIGLSLLHTFRIPTAGVRTIRTALDVAKDIGYRHTTWLHGSAAASFGTTIIKVDTTAQTETRHTIMATLIAGLSASDLGGSPSGQAGPEFGFNAAELELDLEHRLGNPERSFATSTTLRFGILSRAERVGPDIGWVGLRESILFF